MSDEQSVLFPEYVWKTLSRIETDVHIEWIEATAKRPAVCYLSWSTAWMLLKRKFPASTYSHRKDLIHPDGTVEVEVDVIISDDGKNQQFTNARLAVMDMFFNPIPNPTARQVNDSRQRVLVKALAFAGLGLNLWSDHAIPVGKLDDPITEAQLEILTDLIAKSDTQIHTFLRWCEVDELKDLPSERFTSAKGLLEAKVKRIKAEAAEKKMRKGK